MNRSVFQLIDLDRTLFNTAFFAKALTDEIERTEPGLGSRLEELFEAAYEKEQTFFMLRYLRETHGNEWFENLVQRVVAVHGVDAFKMPGLEARLSVADKVTPRRPSWGLLTYGDEIDQRMKMRIIGLEHAPVVFTPTPDKGDILRSWKKDDGTFTLPAEFGGGQVERLTFEDDKLRAFKHLPKDVIGYWISSDDVASERLDAEQQAGEVPRAVIAVSGLQEIIKKIETL